MNKNLELLKKLIKDTKKGKVDWIKAPKSVIGRRLIVSRDHWKGEMNLTKDKKIVFTLNYGVEDFSMSELNVYFINSDLNTREMIWNIEHGIFSFRIENNLKKLIKYLNKKELDEKESNKKEKEEINCPFLNKNWEEVVY